MQYAVQTGLTSTLAAINRLPINVRERIYLHILADVTPNNNVSVAILRSLSRHGPKLPNPGLWSFLPVFAYTARQIYGEFLHTFIKHIRFMILDLADRMWLHYFLQSKPFPRGQELVQKVHIIYDRPEFLKNILFMSNLTGLEEISVGIHSRWLCGRVVPEDRNIQLLFPLNGAPLMRYLYLDKLVELRRVRIVHLDIVDEPEVFRNSHPEALGQMGAARAHLMYLFEQQGRDVQIIVRGFGGRNPDEGIVLHPPAEESSGGGEEEEEPDHVDGN